MADVAGDTVDQQGRTTRPEARDSAPFGSAHGLHLPGILPEPDVILAEGEELTASEKEVLRDLEEALPEEDRALVEAPAGGQAEVAPVALDRQRAQFPWWYALLFFAANAPILMLFAIFGDGLAVGVRIGFALASLVLLTLAGKAWRNRPRAQPSTL